MARQRHSRSGRRTWRFPALHAAAALVILLGTCLVMYPHVASWFSQLEQSRVTEVARVTIDEPPNDDASFRAARMQEAREYNDALESGAIYRANSNVATGEGVAADGAFVYNDILDVTGTGFMGRLMYDSLDIDLPIFHGTSVETLERGVGHLEGTSLPVGGVGTRSVLTAHRGLPNSTLFNDLDRSEVGDTFSVAVLDDVLTYQVVAITEVEPSETEAILPEGGRDLVTLVTCTPLGINSHRILVTAERVTPTPVAEIVAAAEPPILPRFPWWSVILAGTVLVLTAYVWRAGYSSRTPRTRRGGASAPPAGVSEPEYSNVR